MKSGLIYWLTYAGMWLLALLLSRALYVLSDGFCFLMYHIVHHRRRVVRNNLRNAFPEESEAELREIERKFCRYVCNYMLEEVKMLRMSFKELRCRMEYDNKGEFPVTVERHGGTVLLVPYYVNFEWIIGMGAIMQEGDIPAQIYKPLHNRYMDAMFKRIRARFGGYNVSKHSTTREIIRLHRDNKRVTVGMITDQFPNINEVHYRTTFLNQDTGFMDGAEHVAKLMDFPVSYCELKEQRRRYRRAEFNLVTETSKETADGEIIELSTRRLEQIIHREPAYRFWSYKRWKLKREDVVQHG